MPPIRDQRASSCSSTLLVPLNNSNKITKRRQTSVADEPVSRRRTEPQIQENSKLCELVKATPCLYDTNHRNYGKKEATEAAWMMIAAQCAQTVSCCKKRFRNLRVAYGKAIGAFKTDKGANSSKPYYLHKELDFLRPFLSNERQRKVSKGQRGTIIEISSDETGDEDDKNKIIKLKQCNDKPDTVSDVESTASTEINTSRKRSVSFLDENLNAKRRLLSTSTTVGDESENAPEDTTGIVPEEASEVVPEDTTEIMPDDALEIAAEDTTGIVKEEASEIAPENTTEIMPEEASEIAPEDTTGIVPEEASEIAPEDTTGIVKEEASEIAPENTTEIMPEEASEIAPEDTTGIVPEEASEIAPEDTTAIEREEGSEIVPENTTEIIPEEASEIAPEDTTGIVPEEASEIAPEDTTAIEREEASEIAPEDTTGIEPEEASEIAPEDTTSIIPEDGTNWEPNSEVQHHILLEDKTFLSGILFDMKIMNRRQKHICKAKILESVQKVLDSNVDYPSVSNTCAGANDARHYQNHSDTQNFMQQMTLGIASLNECELREIQQQIQQRMQEIASGENFMVQIPGNNVNITRQEPTSTDSGI